MREDELAALIARRTPTATIDYATPRADRPRPTVVTWVAAGFVWAVAGLYGTLAAVNLGLSFFAGSGAGVVIAAIVLAPCVGLGYAEWRALVRRSAACATLVGVLASVPVVFMLVAFAWSVAREGLGSFALDSPKRLLDQIAVLTIVGGLPAFVAVTHVRWAMRLRSATEAPR